MRGGRVEFSGDANETAYVVSYKLCQGLISFKMVKGCHCICWVLIQYFVSKLSSLDGEVWFEKVQQPLQDKLLRWFACFAEHDQHLEQKYFDQRGKFRIENPTLSPKHERVHQG